MGPRAHIDSIDVHTNWGPDCPCDGRVPSEISYSEASVGGGIQWGYDIRPGSMVMTRTKLALDVQDSISDELELIVQSLDGMDNLTFEHIEASRRRGIPEYPTFSPIEIVTHYLKKVFDHVERYFLPLLRLIPVDVVIAVPPVGSPVPWPYKTDIMIGLELPS